MDGESFRKAIGEYSVERNEDGKKVVVFVDKNKMK